MRVSSPRRNASTLTGGDENSNSGNDNLYDIQTATGATVPATATSALQTTAEGTAALLARYSSTNNGFSNGSPYLPRSSSFSSSVTASSPSTATATATATSSKLSTDSVYLNSGSSSSSTYIPRTLARSPLSYRASYLSGGSSYDTTTAYSRYGLPRKPRPTVSCMDGINSSNSSNSNSNNLLLRDSSQQLQRSNIEKRRSMLHGYAPLADRKSEPRSINGGRSNTKSTATATANAGNVAGACASSSSTYSPSSPSTSSSLARYVATSGFELYKKYSPSNYIPNCELSRSRSTLGAANSPADDGSKAKSNGNGNGIGSNGRSSLAYQRPARLNSIGGSNSSDQLDAYAAREHDNKLLDGGLTKHGSPLTLRNRSYSQPDEFNRRSFINGTGTGSSGDGGDGDGNGLELDENFTHKLTINGNDNKLGGSGSSSSTSGAISKDKTKLLLAGDSTDSGGSGKTLSRLHKKPTKQSSRSELTQATATSASASASHNIGGIGSSASSSSSAAAATSTATSTSSRYATEHGGAATATTSAGASSSSASTSAAATLSTELTKKLSNLDDTLCKRATTRTDEIEGLCGLKNIGNTCFMNSVIQCLSHTMELTRFLRNYNGNRTLTSSRDQQILYEFAKLIQDMWTAKVCIVAPYELKRAFSAKHRMYSDYNQQDAQEFLRFFLDSLHGALNSGVKGETLKIEDNLSDNKKAELTWEWYTRHENSLIRDLFVGQLKSTLKCTVCGNTSVTFDPFWDLSVPLPSSTHCKLEACLDLFIREEVLDADEMPTCSQCKTRRKCTKSFTIQRFPKYLAIHLKRFSETRWSKLSNIVEFPTGERELNMAPYGSNTTSNARYSLYAISNHMGSTAGGHYVAVCKHPVSQLWYEFNDQSVSQPLHENQLVSSSAYILFYERN